MTETATPHRSRMDSLRGFLAVPFRGRTYRSLAYLLLAFPLGVLYFVVVTVGVATGVTLSITLVGVPILLGTSYAAMLIAGFEASLARRLLGTDDLPADPGQRVGGPEGADFDSLLAWARRILTARTTWAALVLVYVKFVFGTTAFVVLTVAMAFSLLHLSAPLAVLTDFPLRVGSTTDGLAVGVVESGDPLWVAHSLPAAAVLAAVGVVATLSTLHLANALADLGGTLTARILDVDDSNRTPE